jgi:CDP-diacylglycerol pyrophosphatase
MGQAYRKTIIVTLIIGLALMMGSMIYYEKRRNANTLWRIINERCIPSFKYTLT